MGRVSFFSAYKTWRNKARKYSRSSIVRAALNCLHNNFSGNKLEDLRISPWQLLLIVKWVSQDAMMKDQLKPNITLKEFRELRNDLWQFPEKTDVISEMPAHLFMRRIIYPQHGFQLEVRRGFIRDAALVGSSQNLSRQFKEILGLDVQTFSDLSFVVISLFQKTPRNYLEEGAFKQVESCYSQEVVAKFLMVISLTYNELIEYCQGLPDAKQTVASEYFEFPRLIRYPLITLDGKTYCWNIYLLYRSLESIVHIVLSDRKNKYIEPFSVIFEEHVVSVARKLPALFYDGDELKRWSGNALGMKTPDGLFSYNDSNVFIEIKAKVYREDMMTVGSSNIFSHKTDHIIKAVQQGWSASTAFRDLETVPQQVRSALKDYLIIVVNKDLLVSQGEQLASMYPKDKLTPKNGNTDCWLPLSRVYVLSIDEYERLMLELVNSEKTLIELLDLCIKADSDPSTSVLSFHQHLDRLEIPWREADLVTEEYEASTKRVIEAATPLKI